MVAHMTRRQRREFREIRESLQRLPSLDLPPGQFIYKDRQSSDVRDEASHELVSVDHPRPQVDIPVVGPAEDLVRLDLVKDAFQAVSKILGLVSEVVTHDVSRSVVSPGAVTPTAPDATVQAVSGSPAADTRAGAAGPHPPAPARGQAG